MRKVSVAREFAKVFVAATLLFAMLLSFRSWHPHGLMQALPTPEAMRGHEVLWRVLFIAVASIVLGLLATLLTWLSRSDWEEELASDRPIEPSDGSLVVGYGKIAIGALFAVGGLVAWNIVAIVGGAGLGLIGLSWIASHSRQVARYEQALAAWNARHGVDEAKSPVNPPASQEPHA